MATLTSARRVSGRALIALTAGLLLAAGALATGAHARSPHTLAPLLHSRVFASAGHLSHSTAKGRQALSNPDDITALGGRIYVGFQNGVGPQGEPSTTGNRDSTVVAFTRAGHKVRQWDIVGKCDGLTADPALRAVIATVNEDAHSSLYLIRPGRAPVHYRYTHPLASNGGTDAISIDHGAILISASAPGTTGAAAPQAKYPAVYRAVLHGARHTVTLLPLFGDEALARSANSGANGKRMRLALTDPDSSEIVPAWAPRFAGDFMLTSQGDEEQIFLGSAGLSVLKLSASVDDSAWPSTPHGTLYASNGSAGTIDAITGPFERGTELAATTPCDQANAPGTCPAPGFPANYLGQVDPATGSIGMLAVNGAPVAPQGLLFLP